MQTPQIKSDETVMYGYEPSATLTTDRLHCKLQTSPLVREDAKQELTSITGLVDPTE
jgi:hypothetical protein